ncbi:L-threonine dehydratase biosynthetic IlvA [Novipirellula galeiformis]|uniref:L-threonine dehydratase n=1 Tax=Novipirellula galeiformis TaxID=2528004 RepID=A0A5C6CRS3_9BACT|nr:threonine ammonia-lyase [Novipirellula galeiformis]TWU26237.1 L-threonine dehydratase biosynthetic IlvA [Novipirellula galeiformis]
MASSIPTNLEDLETLIDHNPSVLASVQSIHAAEKRIRAIVRRTPLLPSTRLSLAFDANVLLKREDLQDVRSYKIRGAYNRMTQLTEAQRAAGVVCASAGNHAQGFAYACNAMQIQGRIYMPMVTPKQKVDKVRLFGKAYVEVILVGDTFDDAAAEAHKATSEGLTYVPPFDDPGIIAGQGTVGLEILEDHPDPIDFVLVAVGGGGLISGLGSYFHQCSPSTKVIGVEPSGAPAMYESLKQGKVVTLDSIDNFVDGAAVKRVGDLNFAIAQQVIHKMLLVPEGKVCSEMLRLYNDEGLVVEPAGALAIAALEQIKAEIKGKTVVCIVSGSNNDINRTEEIRDRALLYEGLQHYFVIKFPQRAGALRDFLNNVLGPTDDITHFEYTKKHNRETGPALVGIQIAKAEDYDALIARMNASHIEYQIINEQRMLFELLV